MMNNYIKRSALLLGAFALVGASAMAADGSWRNINYKLQNPAFIPGWSGALAATGNGVGEVWNSAFEIYQVLPDMPAGKYTLTANAHYRYATNDLAKENMKDGKNHNAYIFLGTAKTAVEGLFDKSETAPNNLEEANAAFAAGRYLNTVEFDHPGGDLRLGIANTGGRQDEWTAFDNFKLTGPNGEVAIPNGDFSEALNADKNQTIWDCANINGDKKAPDVNGTDKNQGAGVYRKTNASPYNFGQRVELPAGKYRFGVQSFLRYGGAGNANGKYITCKGAWGWVDGESALDRHVNNNEAEADNAYIYVTDGWDVAEDEVTVIKPVDAETAQYGKENAWYKEGKIMCIYDEKLDVYPDNEPSVDGVNEDGYGWTDSGHEYQVSKFFVNNPDKYRNYIEFELTEPTKVYVGLKKDKNAPTQYWNPFRDFTLEQWDASASGVDNIIAEDDVNAPVEYFNLQGVRVANPTPGLYIVRQGKKVSKQVIR